MKRVEKRRRGISLLEVLIALVVLVLMVLMVATVVPMASRSTHYSADYHMAASLVMGKLNQAQELGYAKMNGPTLGQGGTGIIDGAPTTPSVADNADGSETATFEFTNEDRVDKFFKGVGALKGRGYFKIQPFVPSLEGTTYKMIRATATVTWWNSRGQQQTFAASVLLPKDISS